MRCLGLAECVIEQQELSIETVEQNDVLELDEEYDEAGENICRCEQDTLDILREETLML